jgi:hypothetical protein
MAKYVNDSIDNDSMKSKENILIENNFIDNYILVVLGGDLRSKDLPKLINVIEGLNLNALIAPYRFDKNLVESLVNSPNVNVLDNYVDLFSYINGADTLIYAAGMGMTIEAGVFEVPSIKIEGFHKVHGSVDLAKELNIPIVPISEISNVITDLSSPNKGDFLKNSQVAIDNLVSIINNFDFSLEKSGLSSTKKIWNKRKVFR